MFLRKCIALFLACLALLCLLPGTASAAEFEETAVAETEAVVETEMSAESAAANLKTETGTITEPEEKTETGIETEAISETETEIETEAETETEISIEAETETTLRPETETETEADALTPEEKADYMCRMGSTMKPDLLRSAQASASINATGKVPTRFSSYTTLKVIDVSAWQGTIDWTKVKAAGIQGVFIRAGGRIVDDGEIFSDSHFATYIKDAKAAGLKVGVYFFSAAISNAEAVAEANYTLKLIGSYKLQLPVIIDYEWNQNSGWRVDNNASAAVRTGIIRAFCETVENAGYEAGVYASASVFYNNLSAAALAKEYNIWIAHYTSDPAPDSPCVIDGWQYSSSGKVNGISTAVDLDYWYAAKGSKTFKDVYSSSLYYYNAVYWALDAGITNGYFNKSWFKPADACTREQMVTFLWRMAGSPEPASTSRPFTDVSSSAYYYKAVIWAAEQGITKGYSNGTFGVGKVCLREHAMTFLWRMAGSPEPSSSNSTFSDLKATAYYYKAVLWGCENVITKGYANGTFGPSRNCLREHVITFLYRYHNL